MQMYLLDTNSVINYLDGSMPKLAIAFMDSVVNGECNISVITKMEVLGFSFKKTSEEKVTWAFVNGSIIVKISEDVVNKTIAIRKVKKIKLPDAIIAATAITYDLILLTRNTGDFTNIPDLKIYNPWDA